MRRWLHRRGLWYSPSTDLMYSQGSLLRPGRSRWEGFAEDFRRVQQSTREPLLVAIGYVPCIRMLHWDIDRRFVREPLRWEGFHCAAHDTHHYVTRLDGTRAYLGKPVADREITQPSPEGSSPSQ